MARTTITHACGHPEQHHITGPMSKRAGEKLRLAARLCQECWKAQQTIQAKAETAELPALVGSEKQIQWATTIRATALRTLKEWAILKRDGGELELPQVRPEQRDAWTVQMEQALAELGLRTSAKWWIDNRDLSSQALMRMGLGLKE